MTQKIFHFRAFNYIFSPMTSFNISGKMNIAFRLSKYNATKTFETYLTGKMLRTNVVKDMKD